MAEMVPGAGGGAYPEGHAALLAGQFWIAGVQLPAPALQRYQAPMGTSGVLDEPESSWVIPGYDVRVTVQGPQHGGGRQVTVINRETVPLEVRLAAFPPLTVMGDSFHTFADI